MRFVVSEKVENKNDKNLNIFHLIFIILPSELNYVIFMPTNRHDKNVIKRLHLIEKRPDCFLEP